MFNSKLSPSATYALTSSGSDVKSMHMELDNVTNGYALHIAHVTGHRQILRASCLESLNSQVALYADLWLQYKEGK